MDRKRNKEARKFMIRNARVLKSQARDSYAAAKSVQLIAQCTALTMVERQLHRH